MAKYPTLTRDQQRALFAYEAVGAISDKGQQKDYKIAVQIEQGVDGDALAVPQQAVRRSDTGGSEVYVVMNLKRGASSRVYVTRDGKPVPAPRRGVDVAADARGRTYIDVREGRMYYAIQGEDTGAHELRLSPTVRCKIQADRVKTRLSGFRRGRRRDRIRHDTHFRSRPLPDAAFAGDG